MAADGPLLYHESQKAALCGVHALNTLLQGPFFTEFDLAQMAQELDALERQLLAEAGIDSADYLQHVAGAHPPTFPSPQLGGTVLSKALEIWGLQAVPLTSPDAEAVRREPVLGEAFIANLREHWFTIRRVGEEFWNFNSIYPAPEPLSSFYLSAYLGSLQEQGYTVYWIRGQLPVGPHPDAGAADGPGAWWTPEDARAAQKQAQELKNKASQAPGATWWGLKEMDGFLQAAYKGVLGLASASGNTVALQPAGSKRPRSQGLGEDSSGSLGGDDPELARALAASLREADSLEGVGGRRAAADAGDHADADLAAAIAASLADHRGSGGTGGGGPRAPSRQQGAGLPGPAAHAIEVDGEEEQRAAAEQQQQQQQAGATEVPPAPAPGLALPALGEEPAAGAADGALQLALRLPSGRRVVRRFAAGDTVGHIAVLAAAEGTDTAAHRIVRQFPRQVLEDLGQSLGEVGLSEKEMLVVEPRAPTADHSTASAQLRTRSLSIKRHAEAGTCQQHEAETHAKRSRVSLLTGGTTAPCLHPSPTLAPGRPVELCVLAPAHVPSMSSAFQPVPVPVAHVLPAPAPTVPTAPGLDAPAFPGRPGAAPLGPPEPRQEAAAGAGACELLEVRQEAQLRAALRLIATLFQQLAASSHHNRQVTKATNPGSTAARYIKPQPACAFISGWRPPGSSGSDARRPMTAAVPTPHPHTTPPPPQLAQCVVQCQLEVHAMQLAMVDDGSDLLTESDGSSHGNGGPATSVASDSADSSPAPVAPAGAPGSV
eukprot:scaffold1.g5363.t1